MLEIKGVKKSYGEFQLDCSLNVEKGRITGLVGENGAGKSTLFKAMLGLISYDGGEIKIIAFCKQLENKERRLMEIMECEILADGTRRYRPLFQYQITENRVEDGKFVIVGHHRQINPISDSLARRLMENGMPQETLAGLLNVKKDREGENG